MSKKSLFAFLGTLLAFLLLDGLWLGVLMGTFAEDCAEHNGFSREAQDA